jgi:hypothetical protein
MTLFSRRTLQRLIDENASTILTKEQSQYHVARLNSSAEQSFSFEWEVVVLNVLSKVGSVIHEQPFGRKKPDVFFTSRTNKKVTFIADIVTVSDEGIEKEAPVQAFEKELHEQLSKFGLRVNSFSLQFNRIGSFSPHGSKPIVKVPKRNRFHQDFFNSKFRSFLKRIRDNPGATDTYVVNTSDVDVSLEYNPNRQFSSISYPAHDLAYDLVRNPIYNALRVKAQKLRQAEFSGIRGVIVCDGGSGMFHFRRTGAYSLFVSTDSVIQEFFRQNTSIAFVLLVFIETDTTDAGKKRHAVKVELYENPAHEAIVEELRSRLGTLESLFPTPVIDSRSAVSSIKKFGKLNEGWGFYTNLIMNGMDEVKISGRTLLGLLAGTIKQEDFLEDYGFVSNRENSLPFPNPFAFNLQQGKLIVEIDLEQSKSEDDDYISFKFGKPDAAISPFTISENTQLAEPNKENSLEGAWAINIHFPDSQTRAFNLSVTQDKGKFYGTLESEEGIAHLDSINVLDNTFHFTLSRVTLNQQDYAVEMSGEVLLTGIKARFIMYTQGDTYLSFPVTGTRLP